MRTTYIILFLFLLTIIGQQMLIKGYEKMIDKSNEALGQCLGIKKGRTK